MDAALNRKSFVWGVPGIILQIAGRVMMVLPAVMGPARPRAQPPPFALVWITLGVIVVIIGTGLLINGLSYYAKAKGHSPWWGLMGLLSLIGLLALACLPDRRPRGEVDEP